MSWDHVTDSWKYSIIIIIILGHRVLNQLEQNILYKKRRLYKNILSRSTGLSNLYHFILFWKTDALRRFATDMVPASDRVKCWGQPLLTGISFSTYWRVEGHVSLILKSSVAAWDQWQYAKVEKVNLMYSKFNIWNKR